MPSGRVFGLILAAAVLAWPAAAPAGDVSRLPEAPFAAYLADPLGTVTDSFSFRDEVVFNLRFVLALSEVSNYPTTITIEAGSGRDARTVEAFSGSLPEGTYMFTHRMPIDAGWRGAVPFKIILRVLMYTKTARRQAGDAGEPARTSAETSSSYVYRKVEGTFNVR